MRDLSIQDSLVVAFFAIYAFNLRETTKLAADWGAFKCRDASIIRRKLFRVSLPLLVLIPSLMYVPFARMVAAQEIPLPSSTSVGAFVGRAIVVFAVIFWLGQFPRATKHVWSWWAARAIQQGQPERD